MFSRGQIFEGLIGGIRRSARVIAIVDGGRVGWLEFLDCAPSEQLGLLRA
jgi:hypothetical protein